VNEPLPQRAAIIGGGPAGLMAADVLGAAGVAVDVYDRMPTVGRKFLMAGRGGLNLTHSEPFETFITRYGAAAERLRPTLDAFPPAKLIQWAEGLGEPTFVGSSGRVFPKSMKASPLLRAWLARLRDHGVQFHLRHEWRGWDEAGALLFRSPEAADVPVRPDATILALGGGSWPKLGSDGSWVAILGPENIGIEPLVPSNCGFAIRWSDMIRRRFAGQPLKHVALSFGGRTVRGECVITEYGIEGGAVYALSPSLRDAIAASRPAKLVIDLRPDIPMAELAKKLERPKSGQSLANFLRKTVNLSPLETNLLREAYGIELPADAATLSKRIKSLPLILTAPQAITRAISTAGGVTFSALDDDLMLRARPGVFATGEMLDWEAPTGGYLLQACFATGAAAARGVLLWLASEQPSKHHFDALL
jgi:uncharacterized flavoprotein (TIGR03862 family)